MNKLIVVARVVALTSSGVPETGLAFASLTGPADQIQNKQQGPAGRATALDEVCWVEAMFSMPYDKTSRQHVFTVLS